MSKKSTQDQINKLKEALAQLPIEPPNKNARKEWEAQKKEMERMLKTLEEDLALQSETERKFDNFWQSLDYRFPEYAREDQIEEVCKEVAFNAFKKGIELGIIIEEGSQYERQPLDKVKFNHVKTIVNRSAKTFIYEPENKNE
jgi:hypothetical protein